MTFRSILGKTVFFSLLTFVTYLTVAPNPPDSGSGMAATRMIAEALFGSAEYADKVAHFAAYLALGCSAMLADLFPRRSWAAPLALALYGAALEGVQYFVDTRAADGFDAMANALGAVAGYAGFAIILSAAGAGRRASTE
ncbi:MAG: VanZ family protein [Pseudomonadota bacterium]